MHVNSKNSSPLPAYESGREPYGTKSESSTEPYGTKNESGREPYGTKNESDRVPYGTRIESGREPYGAESEKAQSTKLNSGDSSLKAKDKELNIERLTTATIIEKINDRVKVFSDHNNGLWDISSQMREVFSSRRHDIYQWVESRSCLGGRGSAMNLMRYYDVVSSAYYSKEIESSEKLSDVISNKVKEKKIDKNYSGLHSPCLYSQIDAEYAKPMLEMDKQRVLSVVDAASSMANYLVRITKSDIIDPLVIYKTASAVLDVSEFCVREAEALISVSKNNESFFNRHFPSCCKEQLSDENRFISMASLASNITQNLTEIKNQARESLFSMAHSIVPDNQGDVSEFLSRKDVGKKFLLP